MPFPSKETRFKPGGPGGPGRTPYKKVSEIIAEVLASGTIKGKPIPKGRTVADVLAEVFVAQAMKGNFPFAKEVLDRTEGKVPDRVQHGGDPGNPVPVVILKGVSASALLPKAESGPEAEPDADDVCDP